MGTGYKSAPFAPTVVVGRLKGTIPLTRLNFQAGALQVAAMVGDTWSQTSSLVSNELLQLMLTTLSGEEIQVVIDLQEFDRLDEFETAVLEQLPIIGGHSTSGSELAFVHKDTGEILANPIWDTLRDCNRFNLVVRQLQSSRTQTATEEKRQIKQFEYHPFGRVVCCPMLSRTRSM